MADHGWADADRAGVGAGATLVFGEFELGLDPPVLHRAGERVELRSTPLRLLAALASRAGRVVTKTELLDTVWPGVVVGEASLATALREVRRALGDDGTTQTTVRTLRGQGYEFLLAVERRDGSADPTAGGVESGFFGRDAVLATLVARVHDAIAGRGGIGLVAGEPGIGKTRLLGELTARVGSKVRVVSGWCWEEEGAAAYWPWLQIFRHLADTVPVEELREWAGKDASLLAAVGAEFGLPFKTDEVVDLSRPDARFRMFDATTTALRAAAARTPLLLVLEDLHWADASSLHFLEFLSHELGDARIAVVATYRDGAVEAGHPLAETLGQLAQREACVTHTLEGLDGAAVDALVSFLTEGRADPTLTRDAREKTGGNPFLIRALVGAGDAGGALGDGAAASLQGALRRRLQGLGASTRELLETAAVIGPEFSLDLLGDATGGDALAAAEDLEPARAQRLVTQRRAGVYGFVHALIQESLYAELPPTRRIEVHRRVGESLERRHGDHLAPHYAELSRHFGEAAAGDDGADPAHRYARAAADRYLELHAFDEAAAHYGRAARALERRGGDDAARIEIDVLHGEALVRAGAHQDAAPLFARAAAEAKRIGAGSLQVRAAIGAVGWISSMGVLDRAGARLLEDALAAVSEGEDAERAHLLLRLAAHYSAAVQFDRAEEAMDEGAALAEASGDPRIQAFALRTLAYNRAGHADPEERIRAADAAFVAAEEAGDPVATAMATFLRMTALLVRGDVAQADAAAETLARSVQQHRLLLVEPFLQGYRATRAEMAGRTAEAEALALETAALGQRVNTPAAIMYFGAPQLSQIRREQGRAAEMADAFLQLVGQYPEVAGFRTPVALMFAEAGRDEEARRTLDEASVDGFGRLPRDANWVVLHAFAAEAAHRLGATEHAPRLYELLAPHEAAHAVGGHAQGFFGPVAYFLGLLAALQGELERADQHFGDALARCERLELPGLQARIAVSWAELLVRQPRTQARGVALARRALDWVDDTDFSALRERAERVVGEIARPRRLSG